MSEKDNLIHLREKNIMEKQMELDELDFQIAKNKKERELKKQTGVAAKFKNAMEDLGTALDGFGDMGLDSANTVGKTSTIKSIDKLANFD